jgi:predicted Ser/Thr protein kinase
MPEVGDVLDGYRLDGVIGRGGMGTVYRATDLALEKTVAVKIIAPHLARDDTFVGRFREEAKALARLDARGIVGIHAMRETDDAMILVMEHVEGPSLKTVLQRRGALDPDEAVALTRQILEAVQHAHEADVLHRDLKPSNILIDDGRATITDFGLAKIVTSDAKLTSTHQRMGTVAYMSPEQIRGLQNVNAASDLFSVGLIAYEMLGGRLPYDASASEYAIQRAIVEERFPPPSTYAPNIPSWLDGFVMQLIAKDPAERPRSAAAALQQLPDLDDTGIEEFSLSRDARGASSLSPAQWGSVAAVVGVLLALTFVGVRAALRMPAGGPRDDASRMTMLSVTSTPDGADVILNGDSMGRTPLRHATIPAGSVRVQLAKSGRTPVDTTIDARTTPRLAATLGPAAGPPADTATARDPRSTAVPASPSADDAPADDRATPAPPSPGVLLIRSTPPDASVAVDGRSMGLSPVLLDNLAPGAYDVRLRLNDHRPFRTTVEVASGDTLEVTPSLTPNPAVVTLRAMPSGDVIINGTARARDASTSVIDSLMPGTHDLELVSPQGRWSETVQLDPGERYQRVIDFSQTVTAGITAQTTDGTPIPNATVVVDDSTAGYTPQRLTLHVGQHTIRVSKEGYAPLTRTLMMEGDRDAPIVFELTPADGES